MKPMKTVVLVEMFQDIVQDVTPFVGENAEINAAYGFEEWTGVPYGFYLQEREKDKSSYEILGEDYDGTEIYVRDAIIELELEELDFNLVLSVNTAHLTNVAYDCLDLFFTFVKSESKSIIAIPKNLEEIMNQDILPSCLKDILNFIKNKDVDWINFGSEVPIIEELPVYDWNLS